MGYVICYVKCDLINKRTLNYVSEVVDFQVKWILLVPYFPIVYNSIR